MRRRAEFTLRAALCRQLAELEPANRAIWMVEAEYWLCLSDDTDRSETGKPVSMGTLAALRARVARGSQISRRDWPRLVNCGAGATVRPRGVRQDRGRFSVANP